MQTCRQSPPHVRPSLADTFYMAARWHKITYTYTLACFSCFFFVLFYLSIPCLAVTLHTDNNYLSGTIPSEFRYLKELRILDIDNNKLSGSIPTELGNLVNLFELDLDSNRLNGTIPTEFGLLTDMRELDMSKSEASKLEGLVPLLNW